MVHCTVPKKFHLPDPGRTASFLYATSPVGIRKEPKAKVCCRQIAAFFIRCF